MFRAIELFVTNTERIDVADVVKQLEQTPDLQHDYLHALFTRGNPASEKYHELQVRLCMILIVHGNPPGDRMCVCERSLVICCGQTRGMIGLIYLRSYGTV